jgi:hypothetical protein
MRGVYKRNKLIYGWGINDSDYVTQTYEMRDGKRVSLWRCPYFSDWAGMIKRCHSKSYQKNKPNYVGCSINDEWKRFSDFRKWVDEQPNRDWEKCDLDKDLLVVGNKEYSSKACVYVSHKVNSFVDNKVDRSNQGVHT